MSKTYSVVVYLSVGAPNEWTAQDRVIAAFRQEALQNLLANFNIEDSEVDLDATERIG